MPASERPFAEGTDFEASVCWSTPGARQPRPSPGPSRRPPVARLNGESVAIFRSIRAVATRAACGVLVTRLPSFAHADVSMHSGPMRTIGATNSVECTVTNVRVKPVEDVRILIRRITVSIGAPSRAKLAARIWRSGPNAGRASRRPEPRSSCGRCAASKPPTGGMDCAARSSAGRRPANRTKSRSGSTGVAQCAPASGRPARARSSAVPEAHAGVRPNAAFAAPGTRRTFRARPLRKARA